MSEEFRKILGINGIIKSDKYDLYIDDILESMELLTFNNSKEISNFILAYLPSTVQNEISLSYSADYVQADSNAVIKITKKLLGIGDTVNYTTTLNGETLDNWKVFYVDGDYTYIILDGYLPTAAVSSEVKTAYNIECIDNMGFYSTTNRTDLINAMTIKSNWDSLLTGTVNGHAVNETQTENVWAMESPTVELWVKSWNTNEGYTTLYTRYIDTEDIASSSMNATGYTIGNSANPNTLTFIITDEAGLNNTLYFPRSGSATYWLASASAAGDTLGMIVSLSSALISPCVFNYNSDGTWTHSCRPVICLPSSVVNQ